MEVNRNPHKAWLIEHMPKTTLTLPDEISKTLTVYTVLKKSSMRAQSKVVEEALTEFFESHGVKIGV
jgi:hypothetical protein